MKRITTNTTKVKLSLQEYQTIINTINSYHITDKSINKFMQNILVPLLEIVKEYIELTFTENTEIDKTTINPDSDTILKLEKDFNGPDSDTILKLEKDFNEMVVRTNILNQIMKNLNAAITNPIIDKLPKGIQGIIINLKSIFNKEIYEQAKKNIKSGSEYILSTYIHFSKYEKIRTFIDDYKEIIFNPFYNINLVTVNNSLGVSYMQTAKTEDEYFKSYQCFLAALELEERKQSSILDNILASNLGIICPIDVIASKFNITDPKKATEYLSILETSISRSMAIKGISTSGQLELNKKLKINLCITVNKLFTNLRKNKCYPHNNANKIIDFILTNLRFMARELGQNLNKKLLELYQCLIFFYTEKPKTNADENKILLDCISYAINTGSNYYCLLKGQILYKGLYGTKSNILEAKKYFELASNVNHNNSPETKETKIIAAKALNILGYGYLVGEYDGQIDIEQAQEHFNNAIKIDPYCSDAHMNLAKIELDHFNNHPAAIAILKKAYEINNNPEYCLSLMHILIAMEQFDEALFLTNLLPKKEPNKEYFLAVIAYFKGNEEPGIKFLNNLLFNRNVTDNHSYQQIMYLANLIYKNKLKQFIQTNINHELFIIEEALSLINKVKKILKKINDLKHDDFHEANQELFDLIYIVEQEIEVIKQQKKIKNIKEKRKEDEELANNTNISEQSKEKTLISTEVTNSNDEKQRLLNLKTKQLLSLANLIEENKELTANFVLKKVFIYFNQINNTFTHPENIPIGFVEKCLELITVLLKTNPNKISLIQDHLHNINKLCEAIYIISNSSCTLTNDRLINILNNLSKLSIYSSSNCNTSFDKLLNHLFYRIKNCNLKDNQLFKILSISTKLYLNKELKDIVFDLNKQLIINSNNTDILFDLAILHANDPINFPIDLTENIKKLAAILHEKLSSIPKEQFESIGATCLNKSYMSLWYWQKALTKPEKLFSLKKLQDLKIFIIEELKLQISTSYLQQEVEQFIKNNFEKLEKDRKIFTEYFQKTLPIDLVIEKDHKYHPIQVNGPVHFVWHKNDLKLDQKYNFHKALLNFKDNNKWAHLIDINYQHWRNKLVNREKKVDFIQSMLK